MNSMAPTAQTTPYDALSRGMHWLTVFFVSAAYLLGPEEFDELEDNLGNGRAPWDFAWHETLGMAVFALTALRLLWVLLRPARAVQPSAQKGLAVLAKAVHGLLFALLLLIPATALLMLAGEALPLTPAYPLPMAIELPPLADRWVDLADWGELHHLLANTLMVLAGVHAIAALVHHFMFKDGVLRSMWSGRQG